jgi:hypothetical protein
LNSVPSRRREVAEVPHLETLLDIGTDTQPGVIIDDKGYFSKDDRRICKIARRCAPVP